MDGNPICNRQVYQQVMFVCFPTTPLAYLHDASPSRAARLNFFRWKFALPWQNSPAHRCVQAGNFKAPAARYLCRLPPQTNSSSVRSDIFRTDFPMMPLLTELVAIGTTELQRCQPWRASARGNALASWSAVALHRFGIGGVHPKRQRAGAVQNLAVIRIIIANRCSTWLAVTLPTD